jgi:hypothetical protein
MPENMPASNKPRIYFHVFLDKSPFYDPKRVTMEFIIPDRAKKAVERFSPVENPFLFDFIKDERNYSACLGGCILATTTKDKYIYNHFISGFAYKGQQYLYNGLQIHKDIRLRYGPIPTEWASDFKNSTFYIGNDSDTRTPKEDEPEEIQKRKTCRFEFPSYSNFLGLGILILRGPNADTQQAETSQSSVTYAPITQETSSREKYDERFIRELQRTIDISIKNQDVTVSLDSIYGTLVKHGRYDIAVKYTDTGTGTRLIIDDKHEHLQNCICTIITILMHATFEMAKDNTTTFDINKLRSAALAALSNDLVKSPAITYKIIDIIIYMTLCVFENGINAVQWPEISDNFVLFELKTFNLSDIPEKERNRYTLQAISDIAMHTIAPLYTPVAISNAHMLMIYHVQEAVISEYNEWLCHKITTVMHMYQVVFLNHVGLACTGYNIDTFLHAACLSAIKDIGFRLKPYVGVVDDDYDEYDDDDDE